MKSIIALFALSNNSGRQVRLPPSLGLLCLSLLLLAACGVSTNGSSRPSPVTTSIGTGGSGGTDTSYTLQVSNSGSGSVTSSPAGINCGTTCSATYSSGTSVVLNATAATNYTFSGWSGSGISCAGTGSCTVSMTAARNITATFSPVGATSYALSVALAGSGTVTSAPTGINCGATCNATYSSGTSVTLSATAATGYTFAGWSGSGISCAGTGSCTVSMTATRSVIATFISNTATTGDLCNGLVQDKVAHPMTALAKPAKGQTVVDPQFGTTIRRITNVATDFGAASGVIKPVYSTVPAWNADETYFILYHTQVASTGHHLYNGKTYQYIKQLDINPADLEQFYWDATDPDILYYIDNREASGTSIRRMIRYHVSTGVKDTVRDFGGCTLAGGGSEINGGSDPMYMSWDNDLIGLRCERAYPNNDIFSYRLGSNTESPRKSFQYDTPQAAPSGTQLFLPNSIEFSPPRGQVLDLATLNVVRTLTLNPGEHGSLGKLTNGQDVFNAVSFDTPVSATLASENLNTGELRVIIGPASGYNVYPPSGTHISSIAFKKPGWTAVSVIGGPYGAPSGQGLLDLELLLADTNAGGKVCRIGRHRSWGGEGGPQGYWAEPHVVISPSGTRVLFGSDWGGGNSVDTYVVELPSYTP